MLEKITIIVGERRPIFRRAVIFMLDQQADMQVVAEVFDSAHTREVLEAVPASVALISAELLRRAPGDRILGDRFAGVRLTGERGGATGQSPIIAFDSKCSDAFIAEALAEGIRGILLESDGFADLCTAIRRVHRGETYYSRRVRERLVHLDRRSEFPQKLASRLQTLTRREREVLELTAKGHAIKQIAPILGVSYKTIDAHRTNLMNKLDIHDRVELTLYAIREGLVDHM